MRVTVDDIFEKLGGSARVGKIIGKPTEHAAAMKRRGSIPVAYWTALIAGAEAAGAPVKERDLIEAHSPIGAQPEGAAA